MSEPGHVHPRGSVVSVNVGSAQPYTDGKRSFVSAIGKRPQAGRIAARGVTLGEDVQVYKKGHGGPDRALYAYADEDYAWWEGELGRALRPGLFGENLTLRGIDVNGAVVGERWRVGNAILRVTSPRIPCATLAHVVGDPAFVKRFAAALRPGAYLAIDREGDVGAGDEVEILERPSASIALADFTHIYFFEQARRGALLDVPGMTDEWRAWAAEKVPLS